MVKIDLSVFDFEKTPINLHRMSPPDWFYRNRKIVETIKRAKADVIKGPELSLLLKRRTQ